VVGFFRRRVIFFRRVTAGTWAKDTLREKKINRENYGVGGIEGWSFGMVDAGTGNNRSAPDRHVQVLPRGTERGTTEPPFSDTEAKIPATTRAHQRLFLRHL